MIRSLVILGGFGRGILLLFIMVMLVIRVGLPVLAGLMDPIDLVKAQTGFFHATIERAS